MVEHCSKALNLKKADMTTPVQLENEVDSFYSWHGHFVKLDGHNFIYIRGR